MEIVDIISLYGGRTFLRLLMTYVWKCVNDAADDVLFLTVIGNRVISDKQDVESIILFNVMLI